jgi:hypothetical protein
VTELPWPGLQPATEASDVIRAAKVPCIFIMPIQWGQLRAG